MASYTYNSHVQTYPLTPCISRPLLVLSPCIAKQMDMGMQQGEAAFKQHISLQVRTTPFMVRRSTDWLVGDTVTLLRSVVFYP